MQPVPTQTQITLSNPHPPTLPPPPAGFIFKGADGNEYNVHSDGMGGLQLGNPYTDQTNGEDDTYITSYYAQYNDDSATAPALNEIGCFGDYQVGIPGHAPASLGDGWTAGTYPGSAFPKATVDDAMTADLCGFVAMAHGFSLFGVANGRECWWVFFCCCCFSNSKVPLSPLYLLSTCC